MKKIVLIDGNNLMFRSFFATAYSGNIMRNSKGMPTNALYGFTSMINKIIKEENPSYIAVAFDIGKNFRKKEYSFYKEGRNATPDDLKLQMPIARKLLDAMGITYLELEPYEADDIIGTLVKKCAEDKDFDATIISSDKDLLQLINFETDMKLLKQSDYIRYNEETFKEAYGIDPIKIIDLKALMGDSSDNIPGVKGIGEKTALKLLHEYKSLEGIYENIDNIKGSVHDKLVIDKDNAFMSKKLATIYLDVPLEIKLDDLKYIGPNTTLLSKLYTELEFHSFLKSLGQENSEDIKYINVNNDVNVVLESKVALYIQVSNLAYNNAEVIGGAISDSKYTYYFDKDNIYKICQILKDKEIITFDHKKNLYLFDNMPDAADDLMISSYLLDLNVKEDIVSLASSMGVNLISYNEIIKNKNFDKIPSCICQIAKFIYYNNDLFITKLKENEEYKLYKEIEMPLLKVLSNMEKAGIICKSNELDNLGGTLKNRLNELTQSIYDLAGCTFNISSPKQLGDILFTKLEIDKGKKNKNGFKTDVSTLEKMRDKHPIIDFILEYRAVAKLINTYIDGLKNYICDDGKIHTIFKQTVTRTGRLSSSDPNLQNIPIKEDLGRQIRKAFIPENDLFLSCDYSQIELRVLAHIANSPSMIKTFNDGEDIHAKVASDINGVDIKDVTKKMRSNAKAVIFGIVYGISGYGLGDNLGISKRQADYFIKKYYDMYPEIEKHMQSEINFAKENGYVKTILGRKRYIKELESYNFMTRQTGERMAINTPIQGSAADIIKMAMIKINDEFINNNIQSKMLLQVHDELLFDVKKEEKEMVIKIVKNTMENILKLKVPLKVSTDTGLDWYETK